jgi:hypothetical protein
MVRNLQRPNRTSRDLAGMLLGFILVCGCTGADALGDASRSYQERGGGE